MENVAYKEYIEKLEKVYHAIENSGDSPSIEEKYTGAKNSAGQKHGFGTLIYAEGDEKLREVYEGEWNEDQRHGKGKLIWTNGQVYEGEWKNNRISGCGEIVFSNGNVYKGEWKESKHHGKGKYTWAGGQVYDGEWRDSAYHGKGILTYENEDKYEGEWKDGKKHGRGKYQSTDKSNDYTGEWADGQEIPDTINGIITDLEIKVDYDDLEEIKGLYTGKVINGKPEGSGAIKNDDKQYEGDFKNGRFHGNGKLCCDEEAFYEGEWDDGFLKSGKQTYKHGLLRDGRRYFTSFEGAFNKRGELIDGWENCEENYIGEVRGGKRTNGKRWLMNKEVVWIEGRLDDGWIADRGRAKLTNGKIVDVWRSADREITWNNAN